MNGLRKYHYSSTPLHKAILKNDIDTVKELLDKGIYYDHLKGQTMLVDINATDKEGRTPLYVATFKGNVKIVKLLLDHGANVNNKNAEDPLYAASSLDHTKIIELLKAHCVKPFNNKDKS